MKLQLLNKPLPRAAERHGVDMAVFCQLDRSIRLTVPFVLSPLFPCT
jgi:hypothetical protein